MRARKKFKPGWDDAAYLMRSDPEREKKLRLKAGEFKLPAFEGFNRWRLIAAWKAININIDPERVLGHMLTLNLWIKRK
jgi:hypothetical protein